MSKTKHVIIDEKKTCQLHSRHASCLCILVSGRFFLLLQFLSHSAIFHLSPAYSVRELKGFLSSIKCARSSHSVVHSQIFNQATFPEHFTTSSLFSTQPIISLRSQSYHGKHEVPVRSQYLCSCLICHFLTRRRHSGANWSSIYRPSAGSGYGRVIGC